MDLRGLTRGRDPVTRRGGFTEGALAWVLPAVVIAGALAVLFSAFLALAFDWEIFVGESLNSFFADRLIQEGVLYKDWGQLTPHFPIYPPGFYVLGAPLQVLDHSAIWQGRVLSLLGFALAAVGAWKIARRFGCTVPEALASSLIFPLVSVTGLLVAVARPDGIGLGLIGCALWAATRWEDTRARNDLLAAAAMVGALVLVKYNFAPVGLGIAVAIFLRDRRAGVVFGAVSAGIVVVALVIAQLASGGAFLSNTSDFSVGYSLNGLSAVLRDLVLPAPSIVIVVAAVEVATALSYRTLPRAAHLAWIGGLLVVVSAVKVGASSNYVAPLALLSSVLIGPALMRLRIGSSVRVAAAGSLALALMLLPGVIDRLQKLPNTRTSLSEAADVNEEAASRLARAPGMVFGDRNDLMIAAGKGPAFDNLPMTILAQSGAWDTGALVEQIEAGRLGMIQTGFDVTGRAPRGLSGDPTWPPEIIEAVRLSYCETWQASAPASTGSGLWLYEPCGADGA